MPNDRTDAATVLLARTKRTRTRTGRRPAAGGPIDLNAILLAAAAHLKAGVDWIYPYYRDRALCLSLGVTPYEMLLQAVGATDDPASGGRQMPSHWGHVRYNIVSQSSPTGTQCLQAVGAAEASLLYEQVADIPDRLTRVSPEEVTYLSLGDGSTSEGEFW